MSAPRIYLGMALILACLLAAGCKPALEPREQARGETIVPPGVAGTVAEFAVLRGAGPMPIHGWGVVVGLGDKGSSEVPETLKRYLVGQMVKYKIGSVSAGTEALSPARMLMDKDTAVVTVYGLIPPGAPKGTHFDLRVESLPQSQTISLDGGVLMTTEMHMLSVVRPGQIGQSKCLADGHGPIFVNPFGQDKPPRGTTLAAQPDPSDLRNGVVPDGGTVLVSREIALELRRPDYRIANLIQDRINSKFAGKQKVAQAKHAALIALNIPEDQRRDYEHFLRLLMHVSLLAAGQEDQSQARRLARAILLPTSDGDNIGLTWEAMGRHVLPTVQELYSSDNASAAFYALRTGLRLGDAVAVDPMLRLAQREGSPFQVAAIEEFGRAKGFHQSTPVLRDLLSSRDELVRVAAYETLMKRGPAGLVNRTDVSGQFVVDVVESLGDYTIYVARTGRPRIVLFGRKIPVRRPVFYCPSDELVTVIGDEKGRLIRADRKLPRGAGRSEFLQTRPTALDLIKTLGRLPERGVDGNIEGLGLSYSQVVGVLSGLCKEDVIPANFVLQQPPLIQRMYTSSPGGRADMPDETTGR